MVSFDNYLEKIKNKPFKWSVNDCYTLAFDYLKYKYPNNKLIELKTLYWTKEKAREFAQNFKWEFELDRTFVFDKIPFDKNNIENILTGDLFIYKFDGFETCHIIYENKPYTIVENAHLIKMPLWAYRWIGAGTIYKIQGVIDG